MKELLHAREERKKDDAPMERIARYIYFYNHQRIQTKTKLTPLELRRQFSA